MSRIYRLWAKVKKEKIGLGSEGVVSIGLGLLAPGPPVWLRVIYGLLTHLFLVSVTIAWTATRDTEE